MNWFAQTDDDGVIHSLLQGEGLEAVKNTYHVESFDPKLLGMLMINGKVVPDEVRTKVLIKAR